MLYQKSLCAKVYALSLNSKRHITPFVSMSTLEIYERVGPFLVEPANHYVS